MATDTKKTEGDARMSRNDAALPARDAALPERDAAHGGEEQAHSREFTRDDWEKAKEFTDPERRRRIQSVLAETLLPGLPKKDGWHRCWVSTSHPSDTPQRRMRLGYRYITYEDVQLAGWVADTNAVKDGAFKGCVMWREMLAMEIPMQDYNDLMRELHHDAPREMARGIYEGLDALGAEARERGGRIDMEEGFDALKQFVRPPRQFEN